MQNKKKILDDAHSLYEKGKFANALEVLDTYANCGTEVSEECLQYETLYAETLFQLDEIHSSLLKAQKVERLSEGLPESLERGRALRLIANIHTRKNDYLEAEKYFEAAVRLFESIQELHHKAITLVNLGGLHLRKSRFKEAERFLKEADLLLGETPVSTKRASCFINLAVLYHQTNRPDEAKEYYWQALDVYRKLEDKQGIAKVLGNLGALLRSQGQDYQALASYQEALEIAEFLGNAKLMANNLGNISNIYEKFGDYPNAIEFSHKALAIFEALADNIGIANTLNAIGLLHQKLENYQQALAYFHQSLEMSQAIQHQQATAACLNNIGDIHFVREEYDQALKYFEKALEVNTKIERKVQIVLNKSRIANVHRELGFPHLAYKEYRSAYSLALEIGEQEKQAFLLGDLGRLLFQYPDEVFDAAEPAEAYLERAFAIATILGKKPLLMQIHKDIADYSKEQKDWAKFSHHFQEFYRLEKYIVSENAQKMANKFAYERHIALVEKEKEILEQSSTEIMRAYAELDAEKERAESLLLNVLPQKIASRLQSGERTIADKFDEVSIFFCDIVGFTTITSSLDENQLVSGLNKLFSELDDLCLHYGVEKIKTIGDAYMAVVGVPTYRADHALVAANFAADALELVDSSSYFAADFPINLRIGLHSGPVIAGVIGKHKFTYDIWGDTVNIASRMESHGKPGFIHCSEPFRDALMGQASNNFDFEALLPIEIKGKGLMNTFFVLRR